MIIILSIGDVNNFIMSREIQLIIPWSFKCYGTNKKIYDLDYLWEYYEPWQHISTYCEMYFCNLHISIIFYWPGVHLTDAKKHQILLLCIGRHWWIYCLMIFNVYQTFSSLLTINLIKKGFIWGFVVACYPKEMVKWWCDNLKKVVK